MQKYTIHCTVTNDLNQDQRMHRICSALVEMGHNVVLVGRKKPHSQPLLTHKFIQHRLKCYFHKGFLFYAEFNIRLCLYLLRSTQDIIYSVDTDTILAGWITKNIKKKKLIFDAHEYFTEVPELLNKPKTKKFWSKIEELCLPGVDKAITVSPGLAQIFTNKWNIPFDVLLNVPIIQPLNSIENKHPHPYILYQGMLNEGRGLTEIIDALPYLNHNLDLVIIGEGDLSEALREKAINHPLAHRIKFLGWMDSKDMKIWTQQATLGLNLLAAQSLSYYYSLANKFFDYLHAGVPSINSELPEYKEIISLYDIGYLVPSLRPESIAQVINAAMDNNHYLTKIPHFKSAQKAFNWDNEKIKLKKIIAALE